MLGVHLPGVHLGEHQRRRQLDRGDHPVAPGLVRGLVRQRQRRLGGGGDRHHIATTNGGTTWTAQTSGSTQELNAVDCVSTTQCWVVGAGGVILATTNGGTTAWTAQTSGTTQVLNEG